MTTTLPASTADATTPAGPVRRAGRWIDHWDPEDPGQWAAGGKTIARRNLSISVFAEFLSWKPIVWIGELSYGIYLWHWPVILIIAQDIPTSAGTAPFVWTRVWAVVVTLALADLSFRFVKYVGLPE